MSVPERKHLDWNRKWRVQLPASDADEYMLVPVHEFDRLQKRIDEGFGPRYDGVSAAYFALFGAAVATGAAIPPLLTANSLPSWITPTFAVSAIAFLILGLALVFVERTVRVRQSETAADISQDMRDIRDRYDGGSPPAAEGGSPTSG